MIRQLLSILRGRSIHHNFLTELALSCKANDSLLILYSLIVLPLDSLLALYDIIVLAFDVLVLKTRTSPLSPLFIAERLDVVSWRLFGSLRALGGGIQVLGQKGQFLS
jgi:hypothetical protein